MGVVDADDDLVMSGVADESVDDLTHPAKGIGTEVAGDIGECAQWDAACGCRADDPMPTRAVRTTVRDGLTSDSGFADTGGARQHDPAGTIGARTGGLGDHRKLLRPPDQWPLADHRQILTGTGVLLEKSSKREIRWQPHITFRAESR